MKPQSFNFSKSTLVIFVSAVMAAILLVTMLLIGTQTVAWFKSFLTVDNPSEISNFVTAVSYSTDEGANWTPLESGQPIKTTPSAINDLQLRVSYQGEHYAYLRVSVYGSFYNADTGTYLPQPESFWSFDGYTDLWHYDSATVQLYYKEKLGNMGTAFDLPAFSVNAAFPTDSSVYQDYEGELYVIVDAVQTDRYPVLWGIDTLPWETTTAAA